MCLADAWTRQLNSILSLVICSEVDFKSGIYKVAENETTGGKYVIGL